MKFVKDKKFRRSPGLLAKVLERKILAEIQLGPILMWAEPGYPFCLAHRLCSNLILFLVKAGTTWLAFALVLPLAVGVNA